MSWYHRIASFLNYALPQFRATRRANLAFQRLLSNDRFDTVAAQTALLGSICQTARLRGLTPIMIDWSDLGRGRNGLFSRSGTAAAQLGVHASRVEPVPEPSGGCTGSGCSRNSTSRTASNASD